eukprot:scaffold10274_cov129-Cylindrotheca_fusiformis.AAC.2
MATSLRKTIAWRNHQVSKSTQKGYHYKAYSRCADSRDERAQEKTNMKPTSMVIPPYLALVPNRQKMPLILSIAAKKTENYMNCACPEVTE